MHLPKKVLIIGYVWPEMDSSAAGLREWNLIDCFINLKWPLVFVSPSKKNRYSHQLESLGVSVHSFSANDPSFDLFIRAQKPDFVIFDRFVTEEQFGWRVSENSPSSIRILDTQDLHFLRRTRFSEIKKGKTLWDLSHFNMNLLNTDSYREIASIYRSDATFLLSSAELNLLEKQFKVPKELLHLDRFHYTDPPTSPKYEERENFVMIGNFRHLPNVDGILWFRDQIWPIIHQHLPVAEAHFYGAYPTKEHLQWSDPSNHFYIKGPLSDHFSQLMKYRVNLAPLRVGAGIKGKITDGWWAGLPVVTTSIGAEGMSDQLPWGGMIADSPEEFAKKALELYLNPNCFREKQAYGYRIMKRFYSVESNQKNLIDTFSKIEKSISEIRNNNFIGSMLNHHFLQSTKYFSKWIEAKNSNGLPSHSSKKP